MARQVNSDVIMRHIYWTLCSGDPIHYHFTIQWLKHMVEAPEDRPWAALVLSGPRGIGKTMFTSLLASVIPRTVVFHGEVRAKHLDEESETARLIVLREPRMTPKVFCSVGQLAAFGREEAKDPCRLIIETNGPLDDFGIWHNRFFVPKATAQFPETAQDLNFEILAAGRTEVGKALVQRLLDEDASPIDPHQIWLLMGKKV